MSKHTITFADEIFVGGGFFPPAHSRYGKAGVPVRLPTKVNLGAPIAVDDDGLIDAAASTELPNNTTIVYDTSDDGASPFDNADTPAVENVVMADGSVHSVWPLDVPRNITLQVTHASSVVAMSVLVEGFDEYGMPMSELLAVTATGTSKTAAGKKAFKYIKQFSLSSAGNATGNTACNVGWGDVLGLPFRLESVSDVMAAFCDGTMELASSTVAAADGTDPATTTTGDVRGTIDFNSASNGTRKYAAWLHVADYANKAGLVGVDQA